MSCVYEMQSVWNQRNLSSVFFEVLSAPIFAYYQPSSNMISFRTSLICFYVFVGAYYPIAMPLFPPITPDGPTS